MLRYFGESDDALRGVRVCWPDGKSEDIETQVVLDCSGSATFLANQRATGPKYVGSYDKQIAFFSQVTDAVRGSGVSGENGKDNTLIFYKKKFHWIWFIPLDEEVVSIGLVVPTATFLEKKQTPKEFFCDELYNINPEIRRRIPEMPTRSVAFAGNVSFALAMRTEPNSPPSRRLRNG